MWSTSNYVCERCKDEAKIAIYAYTNAGRQVMRDLLQSGIRWECIKCFVDNAPEKVGQIYNGIKVINLEQMLLQFPDVVVINAGQLAQEEITEMLQQRGVGADRIVKYIISWEDIAYAPESAYAKILMQLYEHYFEAKLDLVHPVKFSEKIQWIKLYDNSALKTRLADKYQVREWVKDKIGEQYLIPLLGVWDRPEDVNYERLPKQFVLKCNHGSGYIYVVEDKEKIDKYKIRHLLQGWMNTEIAYISLELHYRGIPRKILAEQYIQQKDGRLIDYKFHCFGGRPLAVQLVGDRDFKRHTAREIFMDLSWNPMPCTYTNARYEEGELKKPSTFDEMIKIAEILSEGFKYVRVDLYSVDGQVFFGEMTFTPTSGYSKWKPEEYDRYWGQFIDLK